MRCSTFRAVCAVCRHKISVFCFADDVAVSVCDFLSGGEYDAGNARRPAPPFPEFIIRYQNQIFCRILSCILRKTTLPSRYIPMLQPNMQSHSPWKTASGKAQAAGWKTVSGKSTGRRMRNSQREKRKPQDVRRSVSAHRK